MTIGHVRAADGQHEEYADEQADQAEHDAQGHRGLADEQHGEDDRADQGATEDDGQAGEHHRP